MWGSHQKTVYMEKIISPWDLSCVEVRSQMVGWIRSQINDLFFEKWNTPFYRDLNQVRHLTRVGWLFLYKQLPTLKLRAFVWHLSFTKFLLIIQLTVFSTHRRRRSASYRNLPIDLLNKSMDWFLYDRDLRHERVKSLRLSLAGPACV